MYIPKGAVCKSEFIKVARLIMSGDLDGARKILETGNSYYHLGSWYDLNSEHPRARTVSEARAIAGACKAAKKLYNINIEPWTLVVT